MRLALCLAAAAALFPATVAGAQRPPEKEPADSATLSRELAAVDAALHAAELALDTATVSRLLAPSFIWASYAGVVWHRVNRLNALSGGRRQPIAQQVLREEVHSLTSDVALAVRHLRLVSRRRGDVWDRVTVQTRVYRRRADGWEVVAQHASLLDSAAVTADSITRTRRP